jgi:hypothetical protein
VIVVIPTVSDPATAPGTVNVGSLFCPVASFVSCSASPPVSVPDRSIAAPQADDVFPTNVTSMVSSLSVVGFSRYQTSAFVVDVPSGVPAAGSSGVPPNVTPSTFISAVDESCAPTQTTRQVAPAAQVCSQLKDVLTLF